MVTSRDQNAGRSHNIIIDNSFFERVEQFRYLGTVLANQTSIQEESKCRLHSGIACYHSVQNLSFSNLLSKNIKITVYIAIILPVILYGCETWSLTLSKEGRLIMFSEENIEAQDGRSNRGVEKTT
jgi:hypothetical protein